MRKQRRELIPRSLLLVFSFPYKFMERRLSGQ
jgi:hypothetical protein